jgi:hypothetical protein
MRLPTIVLTLLTATLTACAVDPGDPDALADDLPAQDRAAVLAAVIAAKDQLQVADAAGTKGFVAARFGASRVTYHQLIDGLRDGAPLNTTMTLDLGGQATTKDGVVRADVVFATEEPKSSTVVRTELAGEPGTFTLKDPTRSTLTIVGTPPVEPPPEGVPSLDEFAQAAVAAKDTIQIRGGDPTDTFLVERFGKETVTLHELIDGLFYGAAAGIKTSYDAELQIEPATGKMLLTFRIVMLTEQSGTTFDVGIKMSSSSTGATVADPNAVLTFGVPSTI